MLGGVANNCSHQKSTCYKCYRGLWIGLILCNYFREGKWIQILNLHRDEYCVRSGLLKTIARELAKNRSYLMGEQEIRSEKGGTKLVENYILLCQWRTEGGLGCSNPPPPKF